MNSELDGSNFSALGSVYNGEKPFFLNRALQSLQNQTLKANEIILVIDGPISKELYDVVSYWKAILPIKTLVLETNKGLGLALREGVLECSNKIIARFDTDDINRPDRFKLQISALKSTNADIVSGFIEEFNITPGDLNQIRSVPTSHENCLKRINFSNPVNHAASMFYKSKVLACGNYKSFISFEDYHLWVRMIDSGCIIKNIEDILVDVHAGNEMIGRRRGINYFMNEIKFGYWLSTQNCTNRLLSLSSFFLRGFFRLLPPKLVTFCYRMFRSLVS